MYLNLQEFYIFTLVSLSQCIARPAGIAKNLTRTARASFHKVFQKRDVGGYSPLISWHWDVQTLAQELQDTKFEFFKALVFDHATNVMVVVADWVLHMQCGNYRLFDSLTLLREKSSPHLSSSSMASTSQSLRGSPGVVCCLILAVVREKNEATWWAVRNSDTLNRRYSLDPRVLRSFFATASASSFMPLSWPILNFGSRYFRCWSLKRYAFFACFKVQPSGVSTGDFAIDEVTEDTEVMVCSKLQPPCRMTAYFNFALSRSVSRSTTLVHLPKAICFSSEEYLCKPRV